MPESFQLIISLLDSTIRIATPLIFCAMAGIFSERSGIIDIAVSYTHLTLPTKRIV